MSIPARHQYYVPAGATMVTPNGQIVGTVPYGARSAEGVSEGDWMPPSKCLGRCEQFWPTGRTNMCYCRGPREWTGSMDTSTYCAREYNVVDVRSKTFSKTDPPVILATNRYGYTGLPTSLIHSVVNTSPANIPPPPPPPPPVTSAPGAYSFTPSSTNTAGSWSPVTANHTRTSATSTNNTGINHG